MKNYGWIGWLLVVIVAFWSGRLTAPVKVRVEKVTGSETKIYALADIPFNILSGYIKAMGKEIVSKEVAQEYKNQEHLVWQSGYKAGYSAGYDNGYAR